MDLAVQKRTLFGSHLPKLRNEGFIPGELYGHGVQNIHVSIPMKEFHTLYKEAGENTVVNVLFEKDTFPVLIHSVTRHPVTDEFLSVDFYQVRLDEKVTAEVPFRFINESPAVKNLGGLLVRPMDALEIEALPTEMPHDIEVDLSSLTEIGSVIHVKDLPFSPSFKIFIDSETVVATVTEKRAEEEVQPVAEAAPEVLVETEEKKIKRSEEKE
ncbi:MAG: 50S ribosomal protein L25 [Candidatus Harrisonbacteria bacterium CG10_big_fil_rev_8_21_14_0_10_42_17]|uniref:Large ribosomal subunit protein bL25 n=1 Tax=Candidatus Harrisonbacteria bacterium CG10_big_fil_rev_8_21_14_0_10_42_17 TaxID=1974584 RepID=A0A2M6WIL7_9BACT|nr:MAG: 50S ribosomal protein L25 [Candidatus Harrisonbacteria bacterium CG10_big_fil_rev_8_21_14_0_10_42_17]